MTAAFVVTWKGRLIGERYANGVTLHTPLESWSMGKSLTGTLVARLIQMGVYRLDQASNAWVRMSNGLPHYRPSGATADRYDTYRLVSEPLSGRLYVSLGEPRPNGNNFIAGETGVWASEDGGQTWSRISDPSMGPLPVRALLPSGPDTLFAGFYYSDGATEFQNGGLYKGVRNPIDNTWQWTRVLVEPAVSAVAAPPGSTTTFYAFASQVCCYGTIPYQEAGIYKSVDGGTTWTLLPNDGLMDLFGDRLAFSASDPQVIYAATGGGGLFEGVIPGSGGETGCHGSICPR